MLLDKGANVNAKSGRYDKVLQAALEEGHDKEVKMLLDNLLRSRTDFMQALKSRDLHVVQRFPARNFASAAISGYEWLHELNEAGYSKLEIAELLLEDIGDSPWIYFTPQTRGQHDIQTNFHVPGCAHSLCSNATPQSPSYSEDVHSHPLLHTDVRRQVEELCGIGGVVPSSRDVSTWRHLRGSVFCISDHICCCFS